MSEISHEEAFRIKCQKDMPQIKKSIQRRALSQLPHYIIEGLFTDPNSIEDCPCCGGGIIQTEHSFGAITLPKRMTNGNPVTLRKPRIKLEKLMPLRLVHFDCLDLESYVPHELISEMFIVFKHNTEYHAFPFITIFDTIRHYLFSIYNCYIDDAIDLHEYPKKKNKKNNKEDDSHYTGNELPDELPTATQLGLFDPNAVNTEWYTSENNIHNIHDLGIVAEEITKTTVIVKKQFKIYSELKIK